MKSKTLKSKLTQAAFAALAAALLLAGLPVNARVALLPAYTIEDLGGFGGADARAYGINSSGQVAGYSMNSGGFHRAFRFTDGGGLLDLGAIRGSAYSNAVAVNDHGQVAGNGDHHPGSGDYTPFRYTDNVGVKDLGTLPGHYASIATGINNHGAVVGESVVIPPATLTRAFRYTDGAGMQDLGTLGGSRTSAQGINDRGEVVGWAQTPTTQVNDPWRIGHAFLYTDCFGMQDLNNLIGPNTGWELIKASAINGRGQIVGYGERNGNLRAFLYDSQTHAVKNLGTFPNGGISYALALNHGGDVVGAAYLDASGVGNYRAMIYTNQLGMQNLNNLIAPNSGWLLRVATGINDDGQIVGWGEYQGQVHAFRLTPRACRDVPGIGG